MFETQVSPPREIILRILPSQQEPSPQSYILILEKVHVYITLNY